MQSFNCQEGAVTSRLTFWKMARCAEGPPKAVQPRKNHCRKTSQYDASRIWLSSARGVPDDVAKGRTPVGGSCGTLFGSPGDTAQSSLGFEGIEKVLTIGEYCAGIAPGSGAFGNVPLCWISTTSWSSWTFGLGASTSCVSSLPPSTISQKLRGRLSGVELEAQRDRNRVGRPERAGAEALPARAPGPRYFSGSVREARKVVSKLSTQF